LACYGIVEYGQFSVQFHEL